MPHSEIHKRKLKKNLTVAAMILLWCALIWAVTMIKIARADEGFMEGNRAAHQEKTMRTQQEWDDAFHKNGPDRVAAFERREETRTKQADRIVSTRNSWIENWHKKAPARLAAKETRAQAQQRQLEKTQAHPQQWWDVRQQRQKEKSE